MWENLLIISGAIAMFGAATAALAKWVFIPVGRFVHRASLFFEDWFGEPARPGVSAKPGVMERLEKVEYQTHRAELHMGNGAKKLMRELVEETHAAVQSLEDRTTILEDTVEISPKKDGRRPWAVPLPEPEDS